MCSGRDGHSDTRSVSAGTPSLPIGTCLCFFTMPRQQTRGRKRPPDEMPSSATREHITVIREGGRIIKKRIIEATEVDPRTPPIPSPDDTLDLGVDPLQPSNEPGTFKKSPSGNVSRSVSVSATRVFATSSFAHPLLDQNRGVDQTPIQAPS